MKLKMKLCIKDEKRTTMRDGKLRRKDRWKQLTEGKKNIKRSNEEIKIRKMQDFKHGSVEKQALFVMDGSEIRRLQPWNRLRGRYKRSKVDAKLEVGG